MATVKLSLAFIFLFFAIFTFNYFSFPVRGAIEVSSCTSITEPGEYVLVNNISSYDSCIYIEASDVVLDCQGYEIYSEGSYGIFIYNSHNVTVKNCALSGSAKGIVVFYSDNVNIYNSVVTTPQGVEMDTVTGASLENISFYAPYCSEGPRFNYVSFDKLKNIYIEGYFDAFQLYGVYAIGEMSNITLIGRLDCGGVGLSLMSESLHIRDIYISNFSTCVYVSNENNLIENLVLDNCIYGIHIEADYNTFRNNIINADCAIFFDFFAFENIFYNNIINATTYICGDSSYIESSVIYFNTTLTPGENIVGGSYIGGNYWTNPAGNGYSDTCSDADGNGICDEPFLIYSNGVQIYDYLPLAKVSGVVEISSCTSVTEPGEYVLVNNISSYGSCIYIEASDVVLDCQGYEIYSEGDYGIYVYNSNNVSLRNCVLSGRYGLDIVDSLNIYADNFAIYAERYPIELSSSYESFGGIYLSNIYVYGSMFPIIVASNNVSLVNISCVDVMDWCVFLEYSSNVYINNVTSIYTGYSEDYGCSGAVLGIDNYFNVYAMNLHGYNLCDYIGISDTNNVTIDGGSYVGEGGIYVESGSNITFTNLDIRSAEIFEIGTYLTMVSDLLISNSFVNISGYSDVIFINIFNVTIHNTTINTTRIYGLRVDIFAVEELTISDSKIEGFFVSISDSYDVVINNSVLDFTEILSSGNFYVYNTVIRGFNIDESTGSLERIFVDSDCSDNTIYSSDLEIFRDIYLNNTGGLYIYQSNIVDARNITIVACPGRSPGLDVRGDDYVFSNITISGFMTCIRIESGNSVYDGLVLKDCEVGIQKDDSYQNIIRNSYIEADCAIFFSADAYEDTIYNNIINATTYICGYLWYVDSSVIYFNTTLTPGENIVGGSYIGGNYWTNPAGNGYSDTCSDADGNGICDEPFLIYSNGVQIYDYLPLAKVVPFVFSVVFGYDSVNFGIVLPFTIAEMKGIEFNVTVSSTTDYKVMVNATDWSGPATIPANTLYFAVAEVLEDLSFIVAKQLSDVLQDIAVFPSTVSTNYHAYYFNVPLVPPGTYNTIVTITYEVV